MLIHIKQIQAIENEMLKEIVDVLHRNNIVFYMGFGSVLGTVRHKGSIPWDSDVDILVPISMLEKAKVSLVSELSDKFMVHDVYNDKKYNLVFPRVTLSQESSYVIHVDIFPLLALPNDREKQIQICERLNKYTTILSRKQFRRYIFRKSFIKNAAGKLIECFCSPFSCRQLVEKYYDIVKDYSYNDSVYVTCGGACYGNKNILPKSIYGTPEWVDYCDFKVPIPEKWDEYLKNYYNDYMKFPPEHIQSKGLSLTYEINDTDYEKIKEVIGK